MIFPGRLGIVQRLLPAYRAPFFDSLAEACSGGLSLFAGLPASGEAIQTTDRLKFAVYSPAHNLHIGRPGSPLYLCWQRGLQDWLEKWQPEALIVEANEPFIQSYSKKLEKKNTIITVTVNNCAWAQEAFSFSDFPAGSPVKKISTKKAGAGASCTVVLTQRILGAVLARMVDNKIVFLDIIHPPGIIFNVDKSFVSLV